MKSRFARNVFFLAGGASIAQAIPLITLPIISRYYQPELFGEFAIFVSTVTILSAIATFGYESAIVLAPEEDAHPLAVLTAVIAALFTLVITFVFCGLAYFTNALETIHVQRFWFLIPVSVIILAIYKIQQSYMSRDEKFKTLATNQVMVEVINTTLTIIFGVFGVAYALMTAQMSARLVGNISLRIRSERKSVAPIRLQHLIFIAKKYRDFFYYTGPRTLLSQFAGNLSYYLYTSFFASAVTGLIFVAQKIVARPVGVVSDAVSTVFYAKIAKTNLKDAKTLYVRLVKRLAAVSFLVVLIPYFFPRELFEWIMGKEWSDALTYVRLISIGYSAYFVGGALNYVLNRVRKQKVFLLFSLAKTIFIPVILYIAYRTTGDPVKTVGAVAIYDFIHNWLAIGIAYFMLSDAAQTDHDPFQSI